MPRALSPLFAAVLALAAPGPAAAEPGTFLALSDVHYGVHAPEKVWGHPHETSGRLWGLAQEQARKVLGGTPRPGFVLYLGDLPAHGETEAGRKTEFTAVLDGLGKIAGDHTPLFYLPGNNDTIEADYCSFTDGSGRTPFDSSSVRGWPALNAADRLIDTSGAAHGYYSAYPLGMPPGASAGHLRLIAMNTVMFTSYYGVGFSYDPCAPALTAARIQDAVNAQVEWLAGQLADAAAKRETALIAMHVPPVIDGFGGGFMWNAALSYHDPAYAGTDPVLLAANAAGGQSVDTVFLNLVARHAGLVSAILTAHTHLDGLRRLWACDGTMSALALSVPGITTDHGNNPAMKLFHHDAAYRLTGAETLFATPKDGHDWAPANVTDFGGVYCRTAGTCDGAVLADVIGAYGNDGTTDLLNRMLAVLMTGAGPSSPRYFRSALDVKPTCP